MNIYTYIYISVVNPVPSMDDRNEIPCESRYRGASGPPSLTGLIGSKLQQIRFTQENSIISYVLQKWTQQLSKST